MARRAKIEWDSAAAETRRLANYWWAVGRLSEAGFRAALHSRSEELNIGHIRRNGADDTDCGIRLDGRRLVNWAWEGMKQQIDYWRRIGNLCADCDSDWHKAE